MSAAAVALRALFRFWQAVRSGRPSPCRFLPSCSEFGIEAVEIHGALRGGMLASWRVLRCNPLGPYGFDPVPEADSPKSLRGTA